jgi:hypothetical protein
VFEDAWLIRGFEDGEAVVRVARTMRDVHGLLGAPLLADGGIVGILTEVRSLDGDPLLGVLPIKEVAQFLIGYGLSFSLGPSDDCIVSLLPIGRPIRQLKAQLGRALVPGRSWYDIYEEFAPTTTDLNSLIGSEDQESVAPGLRAVVTAARVERYGGRQPRETEILTECHELWKAFTVYETEVPAHEGAIGCSAKWAAGDDFYELGTFVYLNERWLWLVTERPF